MKEEKTVKGGCYKMRLEDKKRMLCDPQITSENRLAAVSDHCWYEDAGEAMRREEMRLRYSLNGRWKFFRAENPESAPEGFEQETYSCGGWDEICVPSQAELQGYGIPQYTNTGYAWEGEEDVKPHQVPMKKNPVGCYVKYFELPDAFRGKRIQLHFEGVETAFHCWMNGVYVGYSEDSYTPAVFDVTSYVRSGTNKLAVEVYRFCTGSWLEDQDFWRMGGIIRDVEIRALPSVHIRDLDIEVDVKENFTVGTAKVKAAVDAEQNQTVKLRWSLYAPDKTEVMETGRTGTVEAKAAGGTDVQPPQVCFGLEVQDALLWSAEDPNRYLLLIEVLDPEDRCIEAVLYPIGFRRIEIRDAVLYLNGKRLRINGVNRHEFSAEKGRSITREEMEWDIRFLKQHNFNAVRTCHYPNQSYWYELCDRYGIYVMDETNLETHGTWHLQEFSHVLPGSLPEWKKACMERVEAMIERDKNHPCIFSWSLGNESWSGQTLYDMSEYARRRDGTRPVHYEGVCHDRRWEGTTDFESWMYASPQMAEEYLSRNPKKPYILCEYSHAMGNSCGNLREYTDLADRYPQYCGGFIWDYVDQALYVKNAFGERVLGYGGDFGDRPTEYNFSANGLLYADRKASPKVQEVKYLYQPYRIEPDTDGITVESRMRFEDGSRYRLFWKAEQEGRLLDAGEIPFRLEAGTAKKFPCTMKLDGDETKETVITASLCLAENTIWGESGWELCFGQKILEKTGQPERNGQPEMSIIDSDLVFTVIAGEIRIQYTKATGSLTSLRIRGKELIHDPVHTFLPNFWRAPTDNDEGNQMKYRLQTWKTASLYPKASKLRFEKKQEKKQGEKTADEAVVTAEYDLGNGAVCVLEHRIGAGGVIRLTETLRCREGLPELPCFGLAGKLAERYHHIAWYGMGPEETYIDRCAGGRMGVYESTVQDQMPGYLIPQECGNHVGCRWMSLTDGEGTGIRVESEDEPFEFSALPYTCHELENARHLWELPRPYASVFRINARQTGVGGDDSWGSWAHEPYIVRADEEMKFAVTIRPILGKVTE